MSLDFNDKFVDLSDSLNTLGLAVIRIIMDRTREGKDVSGAPFKAYNEQYAKRRQKKTNFPPTPVNLTATVEREQRMMSTDNIIHEVNGDYNSVMVFMNYPEKEQLAYYHHISGAGKGRVIREFFDLSDDEVTELTELANELVAKNINVTTAEQLVTLLKKLEVKDPSGKYSNN